MTNDTETRNTTCAERIEAELAGRIEDLEASQALIDSDDDDDREEGIENQENLALDVSVRHTMVVQISTGGPGDQFEIEIERNGYGWELAEERATYRFLDWFDGATTTTDNEAVMAYLAHVAECLPVEES